MVYSLAAARPTKRTSRRRQLFFVDCFSTCCSGIRLTNPNSLLVASSLPGAPVVQTQHRTTLIVIKKNINTCFQPRNETDMAWSRFFFSIFFCPDGFRHLKSPSEISHVSFFRQEGNPRLTTYRIRPWARKPLVSLIWLTLHAFSPYPGKKRSNNDAGRSIDRDFVERIAGFANSRTAGTFHQS